MKKEPSSLDSFRTGSDLKSGDRTHRYYSLPALERAGFPNIRKLPVSLRVLLENLLRTEDGRVVRREDIEAIANWDPKAAPSREIQFTPARVLLQDFTGVPAVVDLAAMRDAIAAWGGDPARINPLRPADLVVDHSVQVDVFGSASAFAQNASIEFDRNAERYAFLKWGQSAFRNFRVVPPDTGIVHQINLEYLASVTFVEEHGSQPLAYFDTLVGTDSHTTMINGAGVLGWGVGGIEAEAALLGQPISMLIPEVIGVRLTGKLHAGSTATDLVLTITERLRKKGVVGKFVEFFGTGVAALALADRATIANMAPEYGATVGFFPIDAETTRYLGFTGRHASQVALVEAYARAQDVFGVENDAAYSDLVDVDLAEVVPSLAGPRRPQDRIPLTESKPSFRRSLAQILENKLNGVPKASVERWIGEGGSPQPVPSDMKAQDDLGHLSTRASASHGDSRFDLRHGTVVIAAITSCTNTSNPSVMVAAGLLAKKAAARGLRSKPWVKTSLAPGSKVVTEYLRATGLDASLDALGFQLVGYGCTTCIGNSGPLPEEIGNATRENDLVVAAVLSGNRNFEGRINPVVRANYLASPPLVVAYALAGTMDIDLDREPLGVDPDGREVFLRDVWPDPAEVAKTIESGLHSEQFRSTYAEVFRGDAQWNAIPVAEGGLYAWPESTYVKSPTFLHDLSREPAPVGDIRAARALALVGDSVTTDHISPAGSIAADGPAGEYLVAHGIAPADFNSYGSRRGNHEVMVRGTFANIRLRNRLAPGTEGGVTRHFPDGQAMSIYDASLKYQEEGVPLIVIAGKEYGTGSSRDWAAKGTKLLGVAAVIAESFERIHRSNLIGMGVLPLEIEPGKTVDSLGLTGEESFDISGISNEMAPGARLTVRAYGAADSVVEFQVRSRIDTPNEADYYRHGGILPFVLRSMVR